MLQRNGAEPHAVDFFNDMVPVIFVVLSGGAVATFEPVMIRKLENHQRMFQISLIVLPYASGLKLSWRT